MTRARPSQLMHTEKLMVTHRETRDKEQTAHRNLVGRLQGENLELLAELNDTKRDLKV